MLPREKYDVRDMLPQEKYDDNYHGTFQAEKIHRFHWYKQGHKIKCKGVTLGNQTKWI